MKNIIKLENGLKFLIISKIKYENNRYFFTVSLSEDLKFTFFQLLDDYGNLKPIEDGALIKELSKQVQSELITKNEENAE